MTDKTKPWLTANHPEAVACKAAGKKLYNELHALGVELNGVGVTTTDDNQEAAIRVYLLNSSDLSKVPEKYQGFEVKPVVTGVISAL